MTQEKDFDLRVVGRVLVVKTYTRTSHQGHTYRHKTHFPTVDTHTFSLADPGVTARFKAWGCGSSLAGIAGSNPASSVDVSLL